MTGQLFELNSTTEAGDLAKVLEAVDRVFAAASLKAPGMGWVGLPHDKTQVRDSLKWARSVPKSQTTLCVLGIGGSCLGAKSVYDFLKPKKQILFFENVDGYDWSDRLDQLNLKKTHFLVISKSGETAETLFQLAHILDLLKTKKIKTKDHVSVITGDKPSTLKLLATELNLRQLVVPEDVGGRFSVLSNVGLAPLAWAGVRVQDLLDGAKWASTQKETIARLAQAYLDSFTKNEWISVFWIYVERLRNFGLWIEQLWAESLAKKVDRKGHQAQRTSTPLSCVGATDQHSLLQQFMEGSRDKHFTFIRCLESEKSKVIKNPISELLFFAKNHSVGELLKIEALAAEKVLENDRHSTLRLVIPNHSAKSTGALLFLFEMVVATLGESLDINAFDQPGVEAIKKIIWGTLGDSRYSDQALPNL